MFGSFTDLIFAPWIWPFAKCRELLTFLRARRPSSINPSRRI